ncbi:MAG: ABC transporter substrate-binding protein [Dechloromonas sp.]|nr:ABC transporter substrate-binding protein [Dechloromonas sp.]
MDETPVIRARHFFSLAFLLPALLLSTAALSAEYVEQYGLTPASPAIDLGTQPHGYPSGVISAVMRHDRLMIEALAKLGTPLRSHPFRRGADMIPLLADQRLEAGLIGDVPTILAASRGDVWIVGLVKQTSTSIVAKGEIQVRNLAGKRIAYVDTSSAHHTLLQGLRSAGLSEADVTLVPMAVDQMPDALEEGKIDAFAAWEPGPTAALARNAKNRTVFRGLSSDYFVISKSFEKRSPEAARVLIAGYVRAIEWMRRSRMNLETAANWAIADGRAFSALATEVPVNQVMAITRREILNIPSAPVILYPAGSPPLQSEFRFLKDKGKLPDAGKWENVADALSYDGLAKVLSEPRRYAVDSFDYAP